MQREFGNSDGDGTQRRQYLSSSQREAFLKDGVLVVDNILTEAELENAQLGLHDTLLRYGIDTNNLEETGHALQQLSSTNGSGGVIDLFYDEWKLQVATNEKLFRVTQELWEVGFCHHGEQREDLDDLRFRYHPYGPFDCETGYAYIDRIGYRIPSSLSERLAAELAESLTRDSVPKDYIKTKKKNNRLSIQRSLTPHLDCCPDRLYEGVAKWRPIQCFVSLTENLEPNTGGFEAAKGHHQIFEDWAKSRPPTVVTRRSQTGEPDTAEFAAPCIGEYTHLRPTEDEDVMKRIQHIPVRAGSAVFWDNRIPHANSYRHHGTQPRAVVYCSFLPDISLNRQYVTQQIDNWRNGLQPNDQWIHRNSGEGELVPDGSVASVQALDALANPIDQIQPKLSPLPARLLGFESWT
jgi:Protein of unknown function (DUF1479)